MGGAKAGMGGAKAIGGGAGASSAQVK